MMFKNPAYLRGFIVTLVIGIGFMMMAVAFFDTETSKLASQLIAVVVLLGVLVGFAALSAWLARKIIHRRSLK